jgi:hypothetical protein
VRSTRPVGSRLDALRAQLLVDRIDDERPIAETRLDDGPRRVPALVDVARCEKTHARQRAGRLEETERRQDEVRDLLVGDGAQVALGAREELRRERAELLRLARVDLAREERGEALGRAQDVARSASGRHAHHPIPPSSVTRSGPVR